MRVILLVLISLIFSPTININELKASTYSKKCKDLTVKIDRREIQSHEFEFKIRENQTAQLKILNFGNFPIKSVDIEFRRLGSIDTWTKTEKFWSSIKNGNYDYVYLPGNSREILKVEAKSAKYDYCKTYYTYKELRDIEIDRKKRLKEQEEKRKKEAAERKKRREKEAAERKKREKKQREIDRIIAAERKEKEEKNKKYEERKKRINEKIKAIENKYRIYINTKQTIIYENCIIDKLSPNSGKELEKVIISNCKRISKKPNWWEKFRYDKHDEPEPPKRALLNLIALSLSDKDANRKGLQNTNGALILDVFRNGAGHKAGLLIDDIILKLNNVLIIDRISIAETTINLNPGQKVPIQIFRKGKILDLNIIMGSRDIND